MTRPPDHAALIQRLRKLSVVPDDLYGSAADALAQADAERARLEKRLHQVEDVMNPADLPPYDEEQG